MWKRGREECRRIKNLKNWASSSWVLVASNYGCKNVSAAFVYKKLKLCFVHTESRNQRDTRIDGYYHQKVQYVFKFLEGEIECSGDMYGRDSTKGPRMKK